MIKIIDFTNCKLSPRNLSYGGRAGEKRGIIYNNQFWMLKFPKNTNSMRGMQTSYTTSPLSEYLGSKIYEILGYDVHKTILGICNDGKRNKIVCACRDFIVDDRNESLIPYIALRNDTSLAVMDREEGSSGSASNLKEIVFQLDKNAALSTINNAKTRFWEVVIIDILINNNDRNEENWGVIKFKDKNKYVLSPIYDNGNCFYNKTSDERISLIMSDKNRLYSSALNGVTAYENNDDMRMTANDILELKNKELKKAINVVIENVDKHLEDIKELIESVPERYKEIDIISKKRKEYYFATIQVRLDALRQKCKENK